MILSTDELEVYFHICGAFQSRAILVVCHYWNDFFSPFFDIIYFLINSEAVETGNSIL